MRRDVARWARSAEHARIRVDDRHTFFMGVDIGGADDVDYIQLTLTIASAHELLSAITNS